MVEERCSNSLGDAVDPFVQHLMDAVGQFGELVMYVSGLKVEAAGKALAGVEHRARGFGAGFLKTVEQVAAALPERRGSCCRRHC